MMHTLREVANQPTRFIHDSAEWVTDGLHPAIPSTFVWAHKQWVSVYCVSSNTQRHFVGQCALFPTSLSVEVPDA